MKQSAVEIGSAIHKALESELRRPRYIDVYTADGKRRAVAVTPAGEFIVSCAYGRGYSKTQAHKFVREVVKECGVSPSKNPPEWFEHVRPKPPERMEVTLSPDGYARFYTGDLVTVPDGMGLARVVSAEPGKITIEKRSMRRERRYR